MKTFDLTLSEPIKYQTGGSESEGTMLELTAPSVKSLKHVTKLKQGFMRCINDMQGDAKPEAKDGKEDHKIKAGEVLAIIQMGSVDYGDYMSTFVNLLSSGICKIDGKEPLNSLLAEKISFEDMERLAGEYLVNFILGSLGE